MKYFTILLALVLTGCASQAIEDQATYVLSPKGEASEFRRDMANCKVETGQQHKAKDRQQEAKVVDCLIERGHKLAKKA